MRKVLCIIVSLFLIVGCFSGCTEEKPVGDLADESVNVELNNNENTEKETENNEIFGVGFNTEVYRVPMTDIYIDLPSVPYHVVELGYTKASFIYEEQCISVTYNDESTNSDITTNHNDLIELFSQGFENDFKVEKLKISNEETVTINGTEMYRFEGELICSKTAGEYSQYVVGYTFIRDGMPCSLIGTVLNKYEEQPESVEKDVEEKVDLLIKTLRSEP